MAKGVNNKLKIIWKNFYVNRIISRKHMRRSYLSQKNKNCPMIQMQINASSFCFCVKTAEVSLGALSFTFSYLGNRHSVRSIPQCLSQSQHYTLFFQINDRLINMCKSPGRHFHTQAQTENRADWSNTSQTDVRWWYTSLHTTWDVWQKAVETLRKTANRLNPTSSSLLTETNITTGLQS